MMVKYIWRCSIIIPLFTIYIILIRSVTISIPEIGLYWDCNYTTLFCIIATFVWLYCSPLKKSCCNGHLIELLFNLAPVEFVLMLIFAQWHFVLTIVLLILIAISELLLLRCINSEEKKFCFSAKRHRQYKNIFKRCSVVVVLIITLIPCWFAFFVYDLRSPTYEADEELWSMIVSDFFSAEEKVDTEDIYTQHTELFKCFADGCWEDFNVSEKITIMQKLVDFEAASLGIPTIPVIAEKLDEYTLGQFNDEVEEMWIDVEHLMESPVKECISTICHEVFHSAQFFLVENIDWNNKVFQSAYFEELRSWKLNEEHYINAWIGGYDAYENQPLEASAREYAEKETTMILSYIH